MSAYVIAQITVNDAGAYEDYKAQVPATLAAYGGEFVVRGGRMETLEGEAPHARLVVIRFPDLDRAKAWHASAEYEAPKALRQSSSDGVLIAVEGFDG